MEVKDRLNVYLPLRLKRRLKMVAQDKQMKMNDVVITAIGDYLDHLDAAHSAPDIVLDRVNQVLNSQVLLTQHIDQLTKAVGHLREAN